MLIRWIRLSQLFWVKRFTFDYLGMIYSVSLVRDWNAVGMNWLLTHWIEYQLKVSLLWGTIFVCCVLVLLIYLLVCLFFMLYFNFVCSCFTALTIFVSTLIWFSLVGIWFNCSSIQRNQAKLILFDLFPKQFSFNQSS